VDLESHESFSRVVTVLNAARREAIREFEHTMTNWAYEKGETDMYVVSTCVHCGAGIKVSYRVATAVPGGKDALRFPCLHSNAVEHD